MSTSTFFRLCVRAPRTRIASVINHKAATAGRGTLCGDQTPVPKPAKLPHDVASVELM
jgi:hypothetical protein